MSIANKALAVLAALAFFFPFITISCNNQQMAHISGYKLVQCGVSPCSGKDVLTFDLKLPGMDQVNNTPGPDSKEKLENANLVFFAAIAIVVAIITLFIAGRGGEFLSGAASIAAIVLLFLFRSKFNDSVAPQLSSPEMKAAGALVQIQVQFAVGFWLGIGASAVSAILAFIGTSSAKSPVVPAGGPVGGYSPRPPTGVSPGAGSQMSACPSCGASYASGNKFCLSCGASLAAPPPPPPPAPMAVAPPQGSVCPSCGSNNSGNNKFCLSCGASLMPNVQLFEPSAPVAAPPAEAPVVAAAAAAASVGQPLPFQAPAETSVSSAADSATASSSPQPVAAAPAPVVADPPAPSASAPAEAQGQLDWAASPPAQSRGQVCSACGAPISGGQKFCLSCGTPAGPAAKPVETSPAPPTSYAPPEPPPSRGQVCSACGAPLSGGQKFCLACGTPVGVPAKPAETPVAKEEPPVSAAPVSKPEPAAPPHETCPACGAEVSHDQRFCLSCGGTLGSSTELHDHEIGASPATSDTHASAVEQARPQRRVCPACGAAYSTDQDVCLVCGARVSQKSSAKTVILIVVILGALGAGGWFGWKYFTRPDVTVTAFPQKTHVAAGGRTMLQASVSGSDDADVSWSVQEGDKGGKVSSMGSVAGSDQKRSAATYSAPETSGTYHVVVTSHANPGRTAKIEIVVGGSILPADTSATQQPDTQPASSAPTTPAAVNSPLASQITGSWHGPTADMTTTIGADGNIAMASTTDPQKNLSGTYHFTDNSHLEINFANGDVRKWEIVGVDNTYLRVSAQSKDGSSATIFTRMQ